VTAEADWLAILDYGTFEVAEDGRRIPILGYAVGAGSHLILVDTGFPQSYIDDPEGAGRRDGLDGFGRLVAIGPENRPDAQLSLIGVSPDDVTELVITHGDIDHIGGVDGFPDATIVVSRAEFEAGPPRCFGDVSPVAWPAAARYRLVEADEEVAAGIVLLATPGHSPGHLSYYAEGALFSGDVLFANSVGRVDLPFGDWDTLLESIRSLADAYPPETIVLSGHGPATTLGDELARNPFLAELRA
jgi:glyoxylase-like metal-dependent hydrolase (beta-lactamase superfamily II)